MILQMRVVCNWPGCGHKWDVEPEEANNYSPLRISSFHMCDMHKGKPDEEFRDAVIKSRLYELMVTCHRINITDQQLNALVDFFKKHRNG